MRDAPNLAGPNVNSADVGSAIETAIPATEVADPVEVALAEALRKAADAANFDAVLMLTAELKTRREARCRNVVVLDSRRRGGKPGYPTNR